MNGMHKLTIEDIHHIRYENYEKTKQISADELIAITKKDAEEGRKMLAELKALRRTGSSRII